MTKYDIIFESLQNHVDSGELTMEDAEVLNILAYEKYGNDETEYEEVTESSEDGAVTYEDYLESMEEELFNEDAFKKYRNEVNNARSKTSFLFNRRAEAPNGSKLKENLDNKYDDARKKEKNLVNNYERYINDEHRGYYSCTNGHSTEDDVLERDIKQGKKDINSGKYQTYPDRVKADRINDKNHKKYGYDYSSKRSLVQNINRKKDGVKSVDKLWVSDQDAGHEDFRQTESYKRLKVHKDNFKKNTQGPSKPVINPGNVSGRYIKKK